MVAAPCQMQGGGGQKRQEARLWLLQTQLSQMEWMATVSSVYTICSCRSCWFCHFSAERTRLSSRKREKRRELLSSVLVPPLVWLFSPIEFGLFCTNPSFQSRVHHVTSSLLRQAAPFGKDPIANSGNAPRHVSRP